MPARRLIAVFATMMSLSGAQAWAQADIEFNLLTYEGVEISSIFTFDEEFTETTGNAVPVDFRLHVPRLEGVELIADGRPDGGIAKFTFVTEPEDPADRQFIENLHIIPATLPIPTDGDALAEDRIRLITGFLNDQVFPIAVQGFEAPEVLALGSIQIGDNNAVELVASYVDPSIGPMLLRIVAFAHPNRADSYVMINNINFSLVPAQSPEDLAATMAGKTMSSFVWLE